MLSTKTIAVIVRDEALLASLTFALGVEGFAVEPSALWPKDLDGRSDISGIVLDSENYRTDRDARAGLLSAHHPVLFLSDNLDAVPDLAQLTPIGKPFQGHELVEAVRRMVIRSQTGAA